MIQVGNDPVRGGFNMLCRVSHGNAETGRAQHGKVVIGVTHGDALIWRKTEHFTQAKQPEAFAYIAGGALQGRNFRIAFFNIQR